MTCSTVLIMPGRRKWLAGILISILLFSAVVADSDTAARPERFMSRSVKYISPDEAIRFLSQLNLGTASRIPDTRTILVTAEPADLAKASTAIKILDNPVQYVIITLPADEAIINSAVHQQLSERARDFSVGNFQYPPAASDNPKVLTDVLGDTLVLIAPAEQIDHLLSLMQRIIDEQSIQPATTTELPEQAVSEVIDESLPQQVSDNDEKFLSKLLASLEEAEKIGAELGITEGAIPITEQAQIQPGKIQQTVGEQPEIDYQQPVHEEPEDAPAPELLTKTIDLVPKDTQPGFTRRSYTPAAIELDEAEVELALPETLPVTELIDFVGKYLDLDLLYDPKEVVGNVTLRVQDKIKVRELYPLLESVLKFRGFVMSRKGNLVTIVPAARALDIDPILVNGDGKGPEYGDVLVTRIFDLRYIDTSSAQNLLTQLKLGVDIRGVPEAKKLIVTGYTYRMSRVEELLSMVDRPGEAKQFRYRQLRYTMARSLATQVEALAGQLGTVSITVSAPTTKPKKAAKTPRGRAARKAPTPPPATQAAAQAGVYLDADERTNRILMIGLSDQLDIVGTLIDSLDVAQQDLRTLRLYDIEYAGAEAVLEKLEQLEIVSHSQDRSRRDSTRGRITPSARRRRGDEPVPPPEAPAGTVLTEEGLVEEPQIVVIESTDSLLVNATAEQHAKIATIIAYVDAAPEEAALNYIVYPLENQDPEELAAILNQLVQETVEETTGGKDTKVVKTTTSKIDDDITIIPDPETYSLVVYANKKNQQWISSLINSLDEYRPQVLLECTLVEVTKDNEFTYDLDLVTKTYGGRDIQTGSKIGGIGGASFGKSRLLDASSSGNVAAFFNSSKLMAFLEAVETKGYGRIMARPKIMVNDNEEGEIKTETTTSVPQIKSDIQIPETGTAVTTTDVSFNEYKEGVTLLIKPHISRGDMLRLEITLNRTDFKERGSIEIKNQGEDTTVPLPPDLISTDITTVSTVPDGTTIILGGLESLDQSKTHSKMPILGDVPIIGGLFRSIDNKSAQGKLYIFVRASIIRPGDQEGGLEDIQRVSNRDRRAFEEMEGKFQKAQDWPGIDPEPLEPIKVLEDD